MSTWRAGGHRELCMVGVAAKRKRQRASRVLDLLELASRVVSRAGEELTCGVRSCTLGGQVA